MKMGMPISQFSDPFPPLYSAPLNRQNLQIFEKMETIWIGNIEKAVEKRFAKSFTVESKN